VELLFYFYWQSLYYLC